MCVLNVWGGDKSKIKESDESHLSWAGGSENRVGEGQASCISPTCEVQRCRAGQDDQRARLRVCLR